MRERRLRRGDRDRRRFGSRSDPWRSEDLLEVGGAVDMWGGGSRALLVIGERQDGQRWRGTLADLSRGTHCHAFASLPRLVCDEPISSFPFVHQTLMRGQACPYLHSVVGLSTSQKNSLTAGLVISSSLTYLNHNPSTWQPGHSTDVVGVVVNFSTIARPTLLDMIDDYCTEPSTHSFFTVRN